MIKFVMGPVVVLLAGLLSLYMVGVYNNNRDMEPQEQVALTESYERSIAWLQSNRQKVLANNNPMLWWMLGESQQLNGDPRLKELVNAYFNQHQRVRRGVWGPLFGVSGNPYLDEYNVQGLPYYNQHFIYALNCAQGIAQGVPLVAQQNQSGFCLQSSYVYRPACITHQLMGINFLHQQACGFLPEIDEVTATLQNYIVRQLTWDIRVVDVYLQRILMLLITGAEAHIKSIWIQRMLGQQQADGGWGDFQSLIALPDGRSLGFSSRIISIGKEKSSLHASAQGIYILSHLISRNASG